MQNSDAMMVARSPLGNEVISPAHDRHEGWRLRTQPATRESAGVSTPPRATEAPARAQRILVPTDFSPASALAVDRALKLAALSEASITLLHIVDLNAQHADGGCGPANELMTHLRSEGTARLSELARSLPADVRPQTVMAEGLPWEEIAEHSAGFDLLVVGRRRARLGWRPFARHTVRRTVENARCPVLVVSL